MPTLTLIGGPNGSGKSTLSEWAELAGRGILLDPDRIARDMSPMNPRGVAVAAGRRMLDLTEQKFAQRESFGVETTLSSKASLRLIDRAHLLGYEVHVILCRWRVRRGALCGSGIVLPMAGTLFLTWM